MIATVIANSTKFFLLACTIKKLKIFKLVIKPYTTQHTHFSVPKNRPNYVDSQSHKKYL